MSLRSRENELAFRKNKRKYKYFSYEFADKRGVVFRKYKYRYLAKNEFPLDLGYEDKQLILLSLPCPKGVTPTLWNSIIRDEFSMIWTMYSPLYQMITNSDFPTRPFFYLFL